MIMLAPIFIVVQMSFAMTLPTAMCVAWSTLFNRRYSTAKAKAKLPMNVPMIGRNIVPIMAPITAAQLACFEPPRFSIPHLLAKSSIISMIMQVIRKIMQVSICRAF